MDGSGGVKFKKSILPHPILRDLHSEIELLLTNCKKSEEKKSGKKVQIKIRNSVQNLIDVDVGQSVGQSVSQIVDDEKFDLIVTDSDSNLSSFCTALEKAFRQCFLSNIFYHKNFLSFSSYFVITIFYHFYIFHCNGFFLYLMYSKF